MEQGPIEPPAAALPALPPPVPAAPPPPPATGADKTAWVVMGVGLLLVLQLHLLPALLAGLLVYSLIHSMAGRIAGRTFSRQKAKLVAIAVIVAVIISASTALILLLLAFLHGKLGHLPGLLDKMAGIIETARNNYGWQSWIPPTEELKEHLAHAVRGHAGEIQRTGGELGRGLVHVLVGVVIGAISAFEGGKPGGPLSRSLEERLRRLALAFERVVFAQVRISLLNTTVTAAYLLIALPLCGVHLPLRKTLVLLTFVIGLLPVIGNLISNTAIVVISLGVSLPVALSSLAYLIVIHKLEYFLNAKIVGGHIHAAAWEILAAMVILEAAFGIAGVVAAPILYAYVKGELSDRRLI